jgi:hypothetical protein
MSQIIRITSEALQATIRRLLPSQQGFGEDLQASNVIMPVIDLTPTAEGSILRSDLQTALDFNITVTEVAGASTGTITATPGFYYISHAVEFGGTGAGACDFKLSDGLTNRTIYRVIVGNTVPVGGVAPVIYVNSGETLTASTDASVGAFISSRQIADINGNLVNPQGFTFE